MTLSQGPDTAPAVPHMASEELLRELDTSIRQREDGTIEMLLYSPIVDFVVNEAVRMLMGRSEPLELRINSVGGDVFAGLMLYDFLSRYEGRITVYIDGLCASMAAPISQQGEQIIMAPNASFMVHRMQGVAVGTPEDMRNNGEHAAKLEEKVRQIMVDAASADETRVRQLMQEETWLTAEQTLEIGWCTSIAEQSTMQDGELEQNARQQLRLWNSLQQPRQQQDASKAPSGLLHRLRQFWHEQFGPGEQSPTLPAPKTDPNMDKETQQLVAQAMGLNLNATQTELINQAQHLQAENKRLSQELQQAQQQRDQAQQQLQQQQEQARQQQAEALVQAAVDAGKIPEGSKEQYLRLAQQDYEATKQILDNMNGRKPLAGQAQPAPNEEEQRQAEAGQHSLPSFQERMRQLQKH